MHSFFGFIKKYWSVGWKALREWRKTWGSIISLLIPVVITFPSINEYLDGSGYLIALVILLVLIGWLQSNKNILGHSELESQLDRIENQRDTLEANLQSVPTRIVKHMFQDIGLNSKDRITIYRYHDDQFINIGRHSDNVEFAKKGRSAYPKDEGFIGQCWREDYVYVERLPIYDKKPERYITQVSKKADIKKGVLREMPMKSRCYYCKKIFDTKGIAFAVIVVETTKYSLGDKKDKVDQILNDQFGKLLIESIEINLPLGKG